MRPSPRLLPVACLLCLAGCGTFYNLNAPPPPGPASVGIPTSCSPFGGITRTGLLALAGPQLGVGWILEGDGFKGTGLFGLGVLAWADIPLSLAGDALTLPIACARSNGEPWATWWGEKEVSFRSPPAKTGPDEPPGGP